MRIPLDHPMWSRLFGPYGQEDLSSSLRRLQISWDQQLAEDLYWERLHHQESLYPVTFAALPWIWQVMPRDVDNLCFLSHVMYCAAEGIEAAYDTARYYPKPSLADPAEQKLLDHQEAWFENSTAAFCDACLRALPLCKSDGDIADLLKGVAAAQGGKAVAEVLQLLSGGYDEEDILAFAKAAETSDLRVAAALCDAIALVSGQLAKALKDVLVLYSGVPVPHAFDQDTDTPDLFD